MESRRYDARMQIGCAGGVHKLDYVTNWWIDEFIHVFNSDSCNLMQIPPASRGQMARRMKVLIHGRGKWMGLEKSMDGVQHSIICHLIYLGRNVGRFQFSEHSHRTHLYLSM